MALGTVSITEGTGTEIGVDNIADVDYQVNKVATGDAGSLSLVSAANPMPVTTGANVVSVSDNGGSLTVDDGGGSVTVDGPLTDAQLRATAVPVSGSLTVSGTLTDAQLRATAVPVTAVVAGPTAADVAMTANPVTVGGRASLASPTEVADGDVVNAWFTRRGALVTAPLRVTHTSASWTASDVAQTVITAKTTRTGATITNWGPNTMFVRLGAGATTLLWTWAVPPYGGWTMSPEQVDQDDISIVWDIASGFARVTEFILV